MFFIFSCILGGGGVDTWVGLFLYFLIYLGVCADCVYVYTNSVCVCVCVCADTGWMGGLSYIFECVVRVCVLTLIF